MYFLNTQNMNMVLRKPKRIIVFLNYRLEPININHGNTIWMRQSRSYKSAGRIL